MEKNPEDIFCKKRSLQFNGNAGYHRHLLSGHEITIQQAVDDLNFKLRKNKQNVEFICEKGDH